MNCGSILGMEILELSEIGEKVIKNKTNILIGLSINNSYFKDGNLEKIIQWSAENAKRIFIMIPDKPAIFTLMSFGYSEDKAKAKARLESNRLENKCRKIIKEKELKDVIIIRWSDIESNSYYIEYLEKIKNLFRQNEEFKIDIENTTRGVLKNNVTDLDEGRAIEIGVNFLFQELAFISNAARILDLDKIAYLYHSTMPVFKNMVEGRYPLDTHNVGYITAV